LPAGGPSLPVVAKCNKTQKPIGNLPCLSLRSVTNHNGNHGPLTIRAILPLTNIQSQTPDTNTPQINRSEHLEWCKKRALEYCDRGDAENALSSMFSDLEKHPETAGHVGCSLGLMMMMGGQLNTPEAARKFILGFN
jgi:hypothetical protein